jgi:hypothetical protein
LEFYRQCNLNLQKDQLAVEKSEKEYLSIIDQLLLPQSELQDNLTIYQTNSQKCISHERQISIWKGYKKLINPVNGVLSQFVKRATDTNDLFNVTLVDTIGKRRNSIHRGSGYQQFVLCIAFRLAFADNSHVPLLNCLMIDEGFGCLDDENIIKVVEVLNNMTSRSSKDWILAVTHRKDMKFAQTWHVKSTMSDNGTKKSVLYQ